MRPRHFTGGGPSRAREAVRTTSFNEAPALSPGGVGGLNGQRSAAPLASMRPRHCHRGGGARCAAQPSWISLQ